LGGLWASLALASDTKEALGTERVGVGSFWVTITAGGKGRLALAIDTLVSSRAQAIWIICSWVTITSLLKTATLDAGFGGGASRVFRRSLRITVTTRRKGGLALAVNAHVSNWTQAVRILSCGIAVAALFKTSATNAGLGSGAC